jgi:hypothetical protein
VSYDLTFRLLIKETPIAGAPLNFGSTTALTDMSGEVHLNVPPEGDISVSSVLPVIEFTPFYDTAANFAARSPVIINARRLVEPLPGICSIVVGSEEQVYFPYENLTDQTMSVPLRYNLLNRMLSPAGEAIPPELFAPGLSGNGFTVPKRFFSNGSSYAGAWQFIGTTNLIPENLSVCSDTGTSPSCDRVSDMSLQRLFDYPRALVIRLGDASVRLAKQRKWKPTGNARGPFYTRGTTSLARIKALMNRLKGPNYICPITPPQCRVLQVPKADFLKAFNVIYTGKVPKGLLSLKRTQKAEVKKYQAILRSLPDEVTKCN